MIQSILVFSAYILLLQILKSKNLLIKEEKYFICDEIICL